MLTLRCEIYAWVTREHHFIPAHLILRCWERFSKRWLLDLKKWVWSALRLWTARSRTPERDWENLTSTMIHTWTQWKGFVRGKISRLAGTLSFNERCMLWFKCHNLACQVYIFFSYLARLMQWDHSVKKKKKATFRQTLCINYEYAFRARPSRCLVAIGKPFCLFFFWNSRLWKSPVHLRDAVSLGPISILSN